MYVSVVPMCSEPRYVERVHMSKFCIQGYKDHCKTCTTAHGFSKLSFMQVFIMKIPQALLHFWVLPSNLGEIPWTGVAGGTFLKLWFVWCKLCNLYYTLRSRPMEPWLILLIIRYSVHCVIPHNIEITLWRNLSVLSRKCNY